MNPMIAALQNSRRSAPPAPPQDDAQDPQDDAAPAGPGDDLVAKLEDMDSKLDQILKALAADNEADNASDTQAPEAPPNDDGY